MRLTHSERIEHPQCRMVVRTSKALRWRMNGGCDRLREAESLFVRLDSIPHSLRHGQEQSRGGSLGGAYEMGGVTVRVLVVKCAQNEFVHAEMSWE